MNEAERLNRTNEIIKTEVDRALEHYVGKAPPVVFRKLRELSERYWRENPLAVESVRLRVLAQRVRSGTDALGSDESEERRHAGGEGKV